MKYRSLVTAIALVLLMILPAAAQEAELDERAMCFNLSEADCDVIANANNNLGSLKDEGASFTVTYDIDLELAGLSEEMPLPLPPEVMAMMEGRSSVALDSSGTVDILFGAEEQPQAVGAVLDVAIGEVGDDLTPMSLEVRMVDNYLYILNPETQAWQGANLEEAAMEAEATEEADAEQTEEAATTPMNPVMGAMDMMDMSALENIDVAALAGLPGLINHVRDGDNFTLTVDLNALSGLLEPEYAELYEGIAAELSAIDQNLAFMFVMLPSIPFEEGTLTLTQHVNTELNMVDGVDVSIALNVNLGQFMGQADSEPIVLHLDLSADISNVGSAPTASAPSEFEEVPLNELLGGM